MKTTFKVMIGYFLTMLQLLVRLIRKSIQTNEVIVVGQITIPDHKAVQTSIKSFKQKTMDVLDYLKNRSLEMFIQKRMIHITEVRNHYG